MGGITGTGASIETKTGRMIMAETRDKTMTHEVKAEYLRGTLGKRLFFPQGILRINDLGGFVASACAESAAGSYYCEIHRLGEENPLSKKEIPQGLLNLAYDKIMDTILAPGGSKPELSVKFEYIP